MQNSQHITQVEILAAKKMTCADIARDLGVTYQYVRKIADELGLDLTKTRERNARVIRKRAAQGATAVEIAAELNVRPDYLRKLAQEIGVYLPSVSEIKRDAILELIAENYTTAEIAEKLDVSADRVRDVAKDAGVKPARPPSPTRNNIREAQILAMAKTGATLVAIGSAFGITRERVRQILNRQGYVRREELHAGRYSLKRHAVDEAEFRRLAAGGMPRPEIAAHFGITDSYAYQVAQRLGVKVYPSAKAKMIEERKAQIVAMRKSGKLIREIKDAHGIHYGHVSKILAAAGMVVKRRRKKTPKSPP